MLVLQIVSPATQLCSRNGRRHFHEDLLDMEMVHDNAVIKLRTQ